MDFVYHPDYLEHHGILGQKWGVRRYQNTDGTWTNEGLDRRRSNKYINSDGSLTKQGIEKYSNALTMSTLIFNKHQKAVKDYDNGKLSKKALHQLEISSEEYDFLNARQKVIDKEAKGAKIGSVVGALAAGSAYTASSIASMGTVPIGALPIASSIGSFHGTVIGLLVGSGMAFKDIDMMRDKEISFVNSLPEDKKTQYLLDVSYSN